MEMAGKLFQRTNYNVTEVAQKVGFFDVSYFSKCFKKYFGVSPKQYQNVSSKVQTAKKCLEHYREAYSAYERAHQNLEQQAKKKAAAAVLVRLLRSKRTTPAKRL